MSAGDDDDAIDPGAFLENVETIGREGLTQLANAIERNEVSDDRVARLRTAIQSLTDQQRAAAAASVKDAGSGDIFTPFNALEQALGFQATPPQQQGDTFVTVDDDDFTPPEVRDEVTRLLGISGGRDVDYFEALREAFETGTAQPGAPITQDLLDQIADSDAAEFADRAADQADQLREQQSSSDATDTGGGGGGASPQDIFDQPGDLGGPTGDRGPIIAEDWFKDDGTTVSIDPAFVDRFVDLARDLGRARQLDLQPDPMKYFELTAESQETLYDVTPREFIRRAVARNDITPNALRSRGFSDAIIPDPETFDTSRDRRDRRRSDDDDDDDDDEDDRFLGMVG